MNKTFEVHVPVEQFGFISCTLEGEADDAVNEYNEIKHSISFGDGIPEKEFRDLYNKVARDEPIQGDPGMPGLNGCQRFAINEAKKFFKRTNK